MNSAKKCFIGCEDLSKAAVSHFNCIGNEFSFEKNFGLTNMDSANECFIELESLPSAIMLLLYRTGKEISVNKNFLSEYELG